jgi:geranylgeranyl pyrophosphate synthase
VTLLAADVPEELAEGMALAEHVLAEHVQSAVRTVQRVGRSILQAGGKRLRPGLTVACGLACSPAADLRRLAEVGAAVELVHMATLVHDDVIDESEFRRGKPTARAAVGNEAAVIAGDVLLAKAMKLLAEDGDLRVIRLVSDAVVSLAEGESLEIEVRGRFDLGREELDQVVEMKTSALLRCACQSGAVVAGAGEPEIAALGEFGTLVGRAFQAVDDVLDYEGDPAATGKPLGQDFREGQCTLPLILLRERGDPALVARASDAFGNDPPAGLVQDVVHHMVETGALADARSYAEAHLRSALTCLDVLPSGPCRSLLANIAESLARRSR